MAGYTKRISEHEAVICSTSYENCLHPYLEGNGWSTASRNPKPRKRCRFCKKQFTVSKQRPEPEYFMRLYAPFYLKGVSPREAAAAVSGNHKTALRYYRKFEKFFPMEKRVKWKGMRDK